MEEERSSQSPPPTGPVSGSTEARTNRDSIKKGLNDVMKFADVNFSRAKQYMTEKAGKAEGVTEFDKEYESLCERLDHIKVSTEKMLVQVEAIIQPNPNLRLENWARSKIDRPKPPRENTHNLLGSELIKSSESFGQETQYGSYLLRCGRVQSKIGDSQKRFEEKVGRDVITPLKAFLEIDIKSILRERKTLRVKRLDLDARRASHKKAQGDKLAATEMALRDAQSEYDLQLEKVRKSMQKVVDTHTNHMGYLRAFMAAQRAFHAECSSHLGDIEGTTSVPPSRPAPPTVDRGRFVVDGLELDREESRKARMLYDYDAINPDEISINSGEMLVVTPLPGDESKEYLMAEYKGKTGKVPSTYLEFL